ncbi:hypothetical protein Tco_0337679 [Tanacetum coccineum]
MYAAPPLPQPQISHPTSSIPQNAYHSPIVSTQPLTEFPQLDSALELGKSISLTEAEEVEAARKVHATHARIVTETVPKLDRRRPSGKVTSDPSKKLKSVISLNPKEQEAADTMKTQMKELVAVSLNLLSRTRKFGHSTMELRSLIS